MTEEQRKELTGFRQELEEEVARCKKKEQYIMDKCRKKARLGEEDASFLIEDELIDGLEELLTTEDLERFASITKLDLTHMGLEIWLSWRKND